MSMHGQTNCLGMPSDVTTSSCQAGAARCGGAGCAAEGRPWAFGRFRRAEHHAPHR